jgi:hypothetical protein
MNTTQSARIYYVEARMLTTKDRQPCRGPVIPAGHVHISTKAFATAGEALAEVRTLMRGAVDDESCYCERVQAWSRDVYGYNRRTLRKAVHRPGAILNGY